MQRARQHALAGAGLAQQDHWHLLADRHASLFEDARQRGIGNDMSPELSHGVALLRRDAGARRGSWPRCFACRDMQARAGGRANDRLHRARWTVYAPFGENAADIGGAQRRAGQLQHLASDAVGCHDHAIGGNRHDAFRRRMEHAAVMVQPHDAAARQPLEGAVADRDGGGAHMAQRIGGQVDAKARDIEHPDQPVMAVVDRRGGTDYVDELMQEMLAAPDRDGLAAFCQQATGCIGADPLLAKAPAMLQGRRSTGHRARAAKRRHNHAFGIVHSTIHC